MPVPSQAGPQHDRAGRVSGGLDVRLVGDGLEVPCVDGIERSYLSLDAAASTSALPAVASRVQEFLVASSTCPTMPKSISATRPSGCTNRLPGWRSAWKKPWSKIMTSAMSTTSKAIAAGSMAALRRASTSSIFVPTSRSRVRTLPVVAPC